jgi:hypothetical protein
MQEDILLDESQNCVFSSHGKLDAEQISTPFQSQCLEDPHSCNHLQQLGALYLIPSRACEGRQCPSSVRTIINCKLKKLYKENLKPPLGYPGLGPDTEMHPGASNARSGIITKSSAIHYKRKVSECQ